VLDLGSGPGPQLALSLAAKYLATQIVCADVAPAAVQQVRAPLACAGADADESDGFDKLGEPRRAHAM